MSIYIYTLHKARHPKYPKIDHGGCALGLGRSGTGAESSRDTLHHLRRGRCAMEKLGISWDSVTFCRLFIGYPPWKKVINMDIYGISWDFMGFHGIS